MLGVKKLIAVVAALCVSSVAYAEKEIVGAFGVRLGGSVDERFVLIGEDSRGWLRYTFKPDKPHEYFADYRVSVTFSGSVFEISAEKYSDHKHECLAREHLLERAIEEKYGTPSLHDTRRVIAICWHEPESNKWRLMVRYWDSVLWAKSTEEKIEAIEDQL